MACVRRCDECEHPIDGSARRRLCKPCWEHRRLYYGWESAYTDARPVRSHILILQAANLGIRRISTLSGVNRKTIRQILIGRRERGTGPSRQVLRRTADAILAIPIPTERHELAADSTPILIVGSRRRLQALVAIGYTQHYLARHIGVDQSRLCEWLHEKRVCISALHARLVAQMYDELSMMPPADQQAWARRSRDRAWRLGWADPFAWVDKDMDDPDEVPDPLGTGRPLTRMDRYLEMAEVGFTRYEIGQRLGIDDELLERWMRENGLAS